MTEEYDDEYIEEDGDYSGLELAVIGMAARFPGAKDVRQFRDNLFEGKEAIHFFSREELEDAGVEAELLDNPNYVKAGGVLAGVEYFDAPFFEYTNREAEIMDPQMRLFHEIAWNTLEDAGYDPERYEGLIGVYAGASPNGSWEAYTLLSGRGGGMDAVETAPLNDKDYLSVRVSYKLNLTGPAFTLYTACSTSLVAVHEASQALLGGECDMALAGGVKVSYPKRTGYVYSEGLVLSPDGHCRTFDAKGAGTIGGDGVGAVLLKR
ncbi:MAG: polyketide synthase, partial [bacterium]|nr:polyketide synthase [bacterium]